MLDGSCSDATGEVPHNFLMDITENPSRKAVYVHTLRDHKFKRCVFWLAKNLKKLSPLYTAFIMDTKPT